MQLSWLLILFCVLLVNGHDVEERWTYHPLVQATTSLAQRLRPDNFTLSVLHELKPHKLHATIAKTASKFNLQSSLLCATDLYSLLKGTARLESWALQMIDASAKLQSGLMDLNLNNLGQYDECIEISTDSLQGQHCLVSTNIYQKMAAIPLTTGLCLPASCTPAVLRQVFGLISSKLSTISPVYITVADKDCHTADSRSPPDTLDIIVLFIVLILILIVAFATTLDYMFIRNQLKIRNANVGDKLVLSFSAYSNGLKVFSSSKNSGQMSCINGIKFLSIAWVVLGHRYMFLIMTPQVNFWDLLSIPQSWSKMFILNAILSVDTFFFIAGFLNAYGFSSIMDRMKGFVLWKVLMSYLHRYIRLTPTYLLAMGITATWLYRLGTGPLWDRIVLNERDNCRYHLLGNLIYINNYLDKGCLLQSWYLGADMQMFWLSPLATYPLWKWPLLGIPLTLLYTAGSIATTTTLAYHFNITTPLPFSVDQVKNSLDMKRLYLPTHARLTPYIVGILFGYVMYRIREKQDWRLRLHKVVVLVLWVVALLLLLYSVLGAHYLYLPDHPYTALESAFYLGFFRLSWSLGLAWLIIACVSGYGGIINWFLSQPVFGPLGRLSYCIYLTHILVMMPKMGMQRVSTYYSDYILVLDTFGDLVIIIGISMVLTFIAESPVMGLEKIIFGNVSRVPVNKNKEQSGIDGVENKAFEEEETNPEEFIEDQEDEVLVGENVTNLAKESSQA